MLLRESLEIESQALDAAGSNAAPLLLYPSYQQLPYPEWLSSFQATLPDWLPLYKRISRPKQFLPPQAALPVASSSARPIQLLLG